MNERNVETLPTPLRRWLGRLRKWLVGAIAAVIIGAAVVVGIGRLLIPYADELRPWIAEQLSERIGQPVSIERVTARWPRLTPRLTLEGLRAGEADESLLAVAKARLELHLPDVLRSGRSPLHLVVSGLELTLEQDAAGRWGLRPDEGASLGGMGSGEALTVDLLLTDATVQVRPRSGPAVDLVVPRAQLRREGANTRLTGRAHLAGAPQAAVSLALRAEHEGRRVRAVAGELELERLRLEALGLESLLPEFVQLPPDRLAARATFDWRHDAGGVMDAEFDLTGQDGFEVSARVRLVREARRIDAELLALRDHRGSIAENVLLARVGNRWGAFVPDLDLERLHGLLGRWFGNGPHWPRRLSGRVRDLDLLYEHSTGSLHRLNGSVRGFGFDLPGDRFGVAGLDLELGVAGDRAALGLSGSPVIDWPDKMRRTIPLDSVSGRLIVSPGAVQIDDVRGRRPEAEAVADGWVWLGGQRPFVDFTVTAERIGAVDPRPWLPAGKIPPVALAWLDRALLGVASASGGINYHFRAGHKFRDWEPGNFQAWLDFDGAVVDYWEDWPRARALDGRVDFIGRSLIGRIDSGRLGQAELRAPRVHIPDLLQPRVSLDLIADDASAGAVAATLGEFPVEGWSNVVDTLSADGAVSLDLELLLPVGRMSEWDIEGRAMLAGTRVGLVPAGLRFPGLTGAVDFDRRGIEPAELDMAGDPATSIRLAAGFEASAWLTISGVVAPSALLTDEHAVRDRLRGAAEWRARLAASPGEGWRLDLSSDLNGLAIRLPRPLAKAAEASQPVNLALHSSGDGLSVKADWGDLLRVEAIGAPGGWRVAAGLAQRPPLLPASPGFEITGGVDRLDLMEWSEFLSDFTAESDAPGGDGRIHLALNQLAYGPFGVGPVDLAARREADQWQVDITGADAQGRVVIPMPIDSGRVIAVDMARLALARIEDERPAGQLENAPVPAQTRTRVPTDVPPLSLLVEELHYRDLPLGRVRLESHARSDGIEIELVEVAAPHLELSGYGRWILEASGPQTEFEGRLISTDLPALLAALGHDSEFNAARAQLDLEGDWPGSPFDFSLARLDGRLTVLMRDGSIPEARPGAGRLLGLVSLSAVPRRLTLDFRDVFGEGLKFDQVDGQFDLADGVAHTEGLQVRAPAADITVRGRTDLGARTYDQEITVEPGVSGTLPVLGGLAGGPAGAAAGLLLRSVLDRPLQGIAEARYRVTGAWDDPQVELVEARAAEPEAEQANDEQAKDETRQDKQEDSTPAPSD